MPMPTSLYHHASLTSTSQHLEYKLKLSRVGAVDWTSRIIAFEKFPTRLHMLASKSLSNFAGTAHRMHQCGLWDLPNCRSCLDQIESGATRVLCYTNTNLATIRKDSMERFIDTMSKLDGNQDTMHVLLQRVLDDPPPSPQHVVHLPSCFSEHSLRALWHGIFPQEFAELTHNDCLTAHMTMEEIIVASLKTLHLLWIARCDLVHTSLSGGEQIEQLLLLREEIEDIL